MLFVFLMWVLALPLALGAQGTGGISGRVVGSDGQGLADVDVELAGSGLSTRTASDGSYSFAGVAPGTYAVVFSSNGRSERAEVEVAAGATATLDRSVDWDLAFLDTVTVFSASRRMEKITEAPSAVTVIGAEEITRESSSEQVPKLLEFTPGTEVTQSGVYDYNLNTRGFNSSLNRRVAVLVDGRNPSVPFLGAQEWAAISLPAADMERLEFVRGPSAALYGANASSGVVNLTTKSPKDSLGGEVRLTAGELSTFNADARWAAELGSGWYVKLSGGVHTSGDYSESRVGGAAEYARPCPVPQGNATDCLPQEATKLVIEDDNEISLASLRLDKYFGDTSLLTMEGGFASVEGPLFQTGIGRVQLTDVNRPWARAQWSSARFSLLGSYGRREAKDQRALSSNTPLFLDDKRFSLEAQTNWDFFEGRFRVVAGAAYSEDDIDSANNAGVQTLMFAPVESDSSALYSQLDFDLTDTLKLVLAGRYDESSLHDSQLSPKASLVWGFSPNHSVRVSYNEAFQVANYSEFFLQANVAAPVNLRAFEAICASAGVSCGFGNGATRVIAAGNEDLEVEETKTFEVGYSGIFGGRAFVTLDYYRGDNENFITDLIPQLGTPLGRVNGNFGVYAPPANLPAPQRAALLAALNANLPATLRPFLTNNLDGSPIFVVRSYANVGQVDTQGIDFGINVYAGDGWRFGGSYSWFDFDIADGFTTFQNLLLPNSPENKLAATVGYSTDRWGASLAGRWVDDFRWVVGPFQGTVESYTTVDVGAYVQVGTAWRLGVSVANALDDEHWEAFGGDLLQRRALANVSYSW